MLGTVVVVTELKMGIVLLPFPGLCSSTGRHACSAMVVQAISLLGMRIGLLTLLLLLLLRPSSIGYNPRLIDDGFIR